MQHSSLHHSSSKAGMDEKHTASVSRFLLFADRAHCVLWSVQDNDDNDDVHTEEKQKGNEDEEDEHAEVRGGVFEQEASDNDNEDDDDEEVWCAVVLSRR